MNLRPQVLLGLLVALLPLGCERNPLGLGGATTDMATYSGVGLRSAPASVDSADFLALIFTHQDYAMAALSQRNSRPPGSSSPLYNFAASPFDEQQMLAMTAIGGMGDTRTGILAAAALPYLDKAGLSLLSTWEQSIAAKPGVDRRSALWGQVGYPFSQSYLDAQQAWYGPEMVGADFLNAYTAAREAIQHWLDEPVYPSGIDDKTRLVLAQESRLSAYWPGTRTSLETFTGRFAPLSGNEQTWVDMVRLTGRLNTVHGGNFEAIQIPMSGADVSFLMIVPAEGAFDTVKARLDRSFLRTLLSQFAPADIAVVIPKFELSPYGWPAQAPSLGDALSEETADFSGVNGQGYLFLSKAHQEIRITLDEQGVSTHTGSLTVHEATPDKPPSLIFGSSASGSALMSFGYRSWSFDCYYPPDQRPFLFLVYDDQSGTLLHIGQITELGKDPVPPDWTSYAPCGDSPTSPPGLLGSPSAVIVDNAL